MCVPVYYYPVSQTPIQKLKEKKQKKNEITKKKKQQTPSGGVDVEQIARDLPLSQETWHVPENVMSV